MDGSLDHEFLRQVGVRALLIKTGPGRLSAQLRMAYSWCLIEGYAGIVTIDGNGKDNVEAVAGFVEKLDQGYDYVQGSRYIPGGKAVHSIGSNARKPLHPCTSSQPCRLSLVNRYNQRIPCVLFQLSSRSPRPPISREFLKLRAVILSHLPCSVLESKDLRNPSCKTLPGGQGASNEDCWSQRETAAPPGVDQGRRRVARPLSYARPGGVLALVDQVGGKVC
jgi:hypothetical protein